MAELDQFQIFGMGLMSIDPLVELKFSEEFKNKLRDLSKKYRNIRADLQPVLDDLQAGNFQGDQIANVGYTVFKLRIKNRDNKKGKSAGYRVIYYVKTATSVFLVTIYSKSEQSNIPAAEIRRILANYE
ncbi:type II toxin-antitoxin system RelE/ParE family toxin [Pseudanabaena yagii]|uniref:type II toxin-antitoxin system RelE/ParE family toxin n=1 Tax=Pseudanabaena yagii TaxID=2661615 RepID=UPI001CECFC74|nr:type II toxin-antitoxin system RelE/ParE family toxin [Pseudanabaena yagii]